MADVKLNSLATKTNANAAAILVKDSATQNAGAEGWITKAQLNQIIRDEVKAQLSAITSGTPDVPVLDGSTMKYMTLANFAKVAGIKVNQGESAYDDANNIDGAFEMARVRGSNIPSSQVVADVINFWLNGTGSVRRQIALNNSGVYSRFRNDQGNWGEWLNVGDLGFTISTGSDANDFTDDGKYLRGGGVTVANLPTNGAGLLQVIRYTGFRKQIWDDTTSRREFIRLSWGSQPNWSSWYEVTLTAVS